MGYSCGNRCLKYSFFVVNFLPFVVGAVILGLSLGIIYSNTLQRYVQNAVDNAGAEINISETFFSLYVLAGVGGFLMLTGFLGCSGACCESTIMLALFFAVFLILFIAELACGIAVLVQRDTIRDDVVYKAINATVQNYNHKHDEKTKEAIVDLQKAFNCCGCLGIDDYNNTPQPPPEPCGNTSKKLPGCCPAIWNDMKSKLNVVGIVALVALVVEILLMVFSCVLCQAFKRRGYQYV